MDPIAQATLAQVDTNVLREELFKREQDASQKLRDENAKLRKEIGDLTNRVNTLAQSCTQIQKDWQDATGCMTPRDARQLIARQRSRLRDEIAENDNLRRQFSELDATWEKRIDDVQRENARLRVREAEWKSATNLNDPCAVAQVLTTLSRRVEQLQQQNAEHVTRLNAERCMRAIIGDSPEDGKKPDDAIRHELDAANRHIAELQNSMHALWESLRPGTALGEKLRFLGVQWTASPKSIIDAVSGAIDVAATTAATAIGHVNDWRSITNRHSPGQAKRLIDELTAKVEKAERAACSKVFKELDTAPNWERMSAVYVQDSSGDWVVLTESKNGIGLASIEYPKVSGPFSVDMSPGRVISPSGIVELINNARKVLVEVKGKLG